MYCQLGNTVVWWSTLGCCTKQWLHVIRLKRNVLHPTSVWLNWFKQMTNDTEEEMCQLCKMVWGCLVSQNCGREEQETGLPWVIGRWYFQQSPNTMSVGEEGPGTTHATTQHDGCYNHTARRLLRPQISHTFLFFVEPRSCSNRLRLLLWDGVGPSASSWLEDPGVLRKSLCLLASVVRVSRLKGASPTTWTSICVVRKSCPHDS